MNNKNVNNNVIQVYSPGVYSEINLNKKWFFLQRGGKGRHI